jgi:hypothetical protein
VRPLFAGAGLAVCPDCKKLLEGVHAHLDVVVLPDETSLTAASFFAGYERSTPPDFAVYLDAYWQPPWPHTHVDWPDFGVPADSAAANRCLEDLVGRAHDGQSVEVGCLGGHGRTGTALGCLAALTGVAPTEAVAWVRANYCPLAIETDEQVAFVEHLA